MEKVHLGFNVFVFGIVVLLSRWLLTLDKPMTNFIGFSLAVVALAGTACAVLEYRLNARGEAN